MEMNPCETLEQTFQIYSHSDCKMLSIKTLEKLLVFKVKKKKSSKLCKVNIDENKKD